MGTVIGTGQGNSSEDQLDSDGLVKPMYFELEVSGYLKARDSYFKYLGTAFSKWTNRPLSGITFLTRNVDMNTYYGYGDITGCTLKQSRFHAVSAHSKGTVNMVNTNVYDTIDRGDQFPNGVFANYDVSSHVYCFPGSKVNMRGDFILDTIRDDVVENMAVFGEQCDLSIIGAKIHDVKDDAIYVKESDIVVNDTTISDITGTGIYIHEGTWQIHDCYIEGTDSQPGIEGIYLAVSSNNGNITGCQFSQFDTGFKSAYVGNIDLVDCIFREYDNELDVEVNPDGRVTIKNNIRVKVLQDGAGYQGAWVSFLSANSTLWTGTTDYNGLTDFVEITDRYYPGTSEPTRVNNTVRVWTWTWSLETQLDSFNPGTVIVDITGYDFGDDDDDDDNSSGVSWMSSGDNFFDIKDEWWFIFGFILISAIALAVFFVNLDKTMLAIYTILIGLGICLAILFFVNGWFWSGVATLVVLVIVAWTIIREQFDIELPWGL